MPVYDHTLEPENEPLPGTENLPDDQKPDIFDYLESQPDVEDPFEPSEPEPEPAPKSDAEIFADFIRHRSSCGQLTPKSALLQEIPELETILAQIAAGGEAFQDIRTEQGKKDIYYYSTPIMAVNYAHLSMLAEEKDICLAIADMVRHNCKIGPAPTALSYFEAHPYLYTLPEIERALMMMKQKPEYADIQEVQSYNGVRYLYSSDSISAKYAKALADFSEESEEIQ